jgi:hypothetical protein
MWGVLAMEDPQVTMGFNIKFVKDLDDFGVPRF